MIGERCKCGKVTRYGSGMTYHSCEGCDECKTTFAGSPEGHKELVPHDLVTVYDEYTTAPKARECRRCHRRFPYVKPKPLTEEDVEIMQRVRRSLKR